MAVDNGHRLQPYPYHAWLEARRKLFNVLIKAGANPLVLQAVDSFLNEHVQEYAATFSISKDVERRLKEGEYTNLLEFEMLRTFQLLGQEILEAGAYRKEENQVPPFTIKHTVRVLVLNFDKMSGFRP